MAWCRTEAAYPLSVSHVLQGQALASRQASGSKASLRVAGYQIGLRQTHLWPRGLHSARKMTLELPGAIFKCNSERLCVCINCICVFVCVTFSPQPAGIQGPFQIGNTVGGGWSGSADSPQRLVGFPSKDSGNQEYRLCRSGTQQNITAAAINHTACPAHHPPATGFTVWVLLDCKSGT